MHAEEGITLRFTVGKFWIVHVRKPPIQKFSLRLFGHEIFHPQMWKKLNHQNYKAL